MERRRIIINFKDTKEDIALYEEIKRHSSQSGFIKDSLRELKELKTKKEVKEDKDDLSGISDILGGF